MVAGSLCWRMGSFVPGAVFAIACGQIPLGTQEGPGNGGAGGALNEKPYCGVEQTIGRVSCGDVNRDHVIDINDSLLVGQYVTYPDTVVIWERAADVDCDGEITMDDANLIAEHSVDLISEFPCAPIVGP